jgi:hypothetical protein
MMTNDDDTKPAPERVAQMFRYSDGKFYWRPRPMSDFKSERAFDIWHRHYARDDIMKIGWRRAWNTNSHRQTVRIDGKSYPVLNVLWCWYHGRWPMGKVERIDGNPDNNGIDNLRPA